MAITKLTDPSALPTTTADYQAQNNAINYHTLNMTPPYPVSSGSVLKGSVFNIGGDLYYTDSDTAITGTTSEYVQLDPGTSTATASYVTSLTTLSVAWSDAYNGYYDASGNLYLFDELTAIESGELTITKTNISKLIEKRAKAYNYNEVNITSADFWAFLDPLVPVVGNARMATGGAKQTTNSHALICSRIERTSTTEVTLYFFNVTQLDFDTKIMTSASASDLQYMEITVGLFI